MAKNEFPHIQRVSDKQSYEFVKSQSLEYILAIEYEIRDGKTPQEIYDWWSFEYGRDEMALRIYHAARHIFNERIDG